MPSTPEIEVFNIGRTEVDKVEVARWMKFIGADEFEIPDDGAISNPALIIALAGKRCYMSFQPGLNPNVNKIRSDYVEYFDNILKSGHGSVLEHSVYNWAIENVTRVFTAEMNRHRAGWAISEGSLRFIKFGKNIPYHVPTSITGERCDDLDVDGILSGGPDDPTYFKTTVEQRLRDNGAADVLEVRKQLSREIFNLAFGDQERSYRLLEMVWDMDESDHNFSYKKKVTSMMRRIVGLGVCTGGIWSGNLRALRHVIAMRTSPAAEEEILLVFCKIVKHMADREPMLFGDFELTDGKYWVPKYPKV